MAIIQISKIQVRSGDLVDLPQLDEAEFGFANDEKRLFIGKTTPNENVEILTAYSSLGFSQIIGANGANLNLSNFEDGQVLAISDVGGNVFVTNRGGTKGGDINLGAVGNLTITGGASGQVLTTDGTGNLSWTAGGGAGGVPGGTNTQVQFNDNSSFGGNSGFTFNKITGNFAIPGNGLFAGNLLIANSLNFTDANGSSTDTSMYYTTAVSEGIYFALNASTRLILENTRTLVYGNTVFVGGNIDTTSTTLLLANANSTTVNAFGSASAVNIGAAGSLTTLRGNLFIANAINFADANGANTDTSVYYTNDRLVTALNGTDKVLVYNANVTINDDLFVNGAIGLTATSSAAINFYDGNGTATDTSIYYNSGSDVLTIALNGNDKITVTNSNVTIQDDVLIQGALALSATASAAINFFDSNGASTDTSIYYANNPGLGITEGLYFALNGSTKYGIFNTENQNYGNFVVVNGNINTTAATLLLANANTTTVNAFGSATNIRMGAAGSLTTLRGNLFIDKALNFADANGANTDTSVYYTTIGTEGLYFALNGAPELAINNGQVLIVNKLNATGASNVALGSNANVKLTGGSLGQALTTDGLGNLSWTTVSGGGSPGGVNTQIQFNDAGSFGGNNSFTFNKTSGNLQVPGNVDFGGNLILGNSAAANVSINFRDANSTATDTSIYYTTSVAEGLYFSLNAGTKVVIENNRTVNYQNFVVAAGNIDTTIATLNFANANTTTANAFGAATAINIGASGSLTTLRGNLFIDKALNFADSTGANTDTAIYYTTIGTEGLYFALNGGTRLATFATGTLNYGTFLTIGNGIGYGGGSGGTVTQTGSRTNGVTIDKPTGSITLVSAAGTTSWQSFTVTNSTVAISDTITVNQRSGTDLYQIFVTNVAAGSFRITFATTGGTTTGQPVFNFNVIKGVTS